MGTYDGPSGFQIQHIERRQVKRILVPQRENPIINRLNKTRVEKHPDLKQEKDDHLRELRKKEQAARLARVSPIFISRPVPSGGARVSDE